MDVSDKRAEIEALLVKAMSHAESAMKNLQLMYDGEDPEERLLSAQAQAKFIAGMAEAFDRAVAECLDMPYQLRSGAFHALWITRDCLGLPRSVSAD